MRFNRLGTAKMRPWLPFFVSQYDGLISYTDSRLELFFEYLEAEGLRSDLTVIVLSDHGEEFLDHGFLAHTQIYDETLRVPLVITHPAADPGRRVSDLVQLVDVPATLYELAGLRPPHDLSGHSLVPRLVGDSVRRERPAFGEVGASRTLYAREGGRLYQLVVTRHPADEWLGRWVTFDLAPGQDSFTIRSFEKPRRVSYTVDGGPRRRAGITTEWTEIEVGDPRRDRPIRISLVAMDCEAVIAHHRRCFSMQIREPALERVELFDLTADRAAATDLSRSEPELTARLMRRLGKLRFKALAQPTVEPLEEEVRKRLEALGYLD
jgi:hypothetical protein